MYLTKIWYNTQAMFEETKYQDTLKRKEEDWESLCIRCGACCGAYDDPCQHLRKDDKGKFYCAIYNERFGLRKTVSGDSFNCVPVKEIINTHWKNDHLCIYKKYLKYPWELIEKK